MIKEKTPSIIIVLYNYTYKVVCKHFYSLFSRFSFYLSNIFQLKICVAGVVKYTHVLQRIPAVLIFFVWYALFLNYTGSTRMSYINYTHIYIYI